MTDQLSRPLPWVAPSILSADFARLGEEVGTVANADLLHVDSMDGQFVPNITVGPGVVAALRKVTRLPLDVHLMIERPERHLEAFAQAGATYLTVHGETSPHLHRTLQRIRSLGMKAGVALNPATPVEAIQYILEEVDLVLVMTVNPGFGGQQLIEAVLPKLQRISAMAAAVGRSPLLEVDGGVSQANAGRLVEAGAQILVAGSAVFGAPDRGLAVDGLRRSGRSQPENHR